ncbi:hypothetical protein D3C85_835410 [compost metagenome]
MTQVLIIVGLLLAVKCFTTAWRYLTIDVYLNVAQAAVDASHCAMMLCDIDDSSACTIEFDLPFIDLTVQPHWWYEIWLFDFIGRQIVAEYSASVMTVEWPEFDDAEF